VNKKLKKPIDESFIEYCTPRQAQALEIFLQYGSIEQAASACGVSEATFRKTLTRIRRRAAQRGWAPANDVENPIPPGYHVKGVSTYYGPDGAKRGQWVKTQVDQEHKIALLLEAVENVADNFRGQSEVVPAPTMLNDDLLCVYPMGDPHLGLYAWAAESGQDFDLQSGERNLVCAVDALVSLAPPARRALIANLGDFFHSDSKDNRTAHAGNPLDVDTRWAKVLSVGIRTMRRCIDKALQKHEHVTVICEIGNHDDHSAVMLAICLREYYCNNDRVHIDTSPDTFHWYRFGANLIGVTHGHRVKARDLPGIMAVDRKEDWGETEFRHWYTGHVHHDTVKEYPGCTVETLRTLASSDAWHHHSGYRSGQDMKCDVWHRKYGRVNRHIVGIRQIWE